MIWNSIPWREDLIRVADRLEERKTQRRWTERTGYLVERDVMVSAYAVRKLAEARKLSDLLLNKALPIERFTLVGKVVDHYRYEFWESFDLENGVVADITPVKLCNQIIHSFVFATSFDDNNDFDGVFVSSDRERRKWLYRIHVDVLISLFRTIGSEDIVELRMLADANGERYITQVLSATDVLATQHGESSI